MLDSAREGSPTAYQRKDAFYQRAKREGFRSRAAYKLQEIQRSQGLLRPGQRVVDLGCWPGGWLQVASEEVGPRGRVVGVDLVPIEPALGLANVIAIVGDLSDPLVVEAILRELAGPADVLLSDAAPKLTGIRATDRAREEALLDAICALVPKLLRPGGDLLAKVLDGPEAEGFTRTLRGSFTRLKSLRPEASRKGTTERYVVARGHRPGAPSA